MEINSRENAKLFDIYLEEYQNRKKAPPVNEYFKMEDAYLAVQKTPVTNRGRLIAYIKDIKIQIALLGVDLCKIVDEKKWNAESEMNQEVFCNAIEILKANSDYIFRFRAILDKVMTIYILIFMPNEYRKFGKKSRKKAFKNIMKNVPSMPPEYLNLIETTITDFDEKYRTAEIHGCGSTSKWCFDQTNGPFTKQSDMFWAMNSLNMIILETSKLFLYMKNAKSN